MAINRLAVVRRCGEFHCFMPINSFTSVLLLLISLSLSFDGNPRYYISKRSR